MKVLYVAPENFQETGGTRRALNVISRVKHYGVEPYVIHSSTSRDGLTSKIGALRSIKKIISTYHSEAELDLSGLDLIVSTSEAPEIAIPGYWLSRKLKVPWTVILQLPINLKYTPASTVPILKDPLWTPQQLLVSHLMKKSVPLTVCKSTVLESTIKPAKFIEIKIPNAVNWKAIQEADSRNSSLDALYLARLVHEKGLFDVLEVWKKVIGRFKDAKLVIAGRFQRGREKRKFFKLVKEYGLRKNTDFKGYLSREEKFSYLKAADVFLYPSKLDSFGIIVLEALACGTPVIAYDIPAINLNYPIDSVETAPKSDTGTLAQKVIDILSKDESTKKKYCEKSKKFASQYTWERVAQEEVKAYKKFMKILEGNWN